LRSSTFFLALALGLTAAAQASAEVYKWVDEDGNVHFGDRPPDTEQHETVGVTTARDGSTQSDNLTSIAGKEGVAGAKNTCDRAARNFKRFLPQLERLAMDGAKGQATDAELKELKSSFVEMRKISTSEFSQECVAEYDSDPQAKAMADCFGNSDDVLSASMCLAFSGSF